MQDLRVTPCTRRALKELQYYCDNNFNKVLVRVAASVGAQGVKTAESFVSWAATQPARQGFTYPDRFKFWAGLTEQGKHDNKNGTVLFCYVDSVEGSEKLVTVLRANSTRAAFVELSDPDSVYEGGIENLIPIFPLSIDGNIPERNVYYSVVQKLSRPIQKKYEHMMIDLGEPEPVDYMSKEAMAVKPTLADTVPDDGELPEYRITGMNIQGTTAARLATNTNQTISEEESKSMKKSTVVTNLINTNKDALKQVGYLNAGRASNKVIKEACRPLLNLMFKPTFMQKLGMKFFNKANPIDVALQSSLSDVLCAQMVQLVIEMRGIEDENIREVAKAGIVYSGLQVSQSIPLEEAIDSVVATLTKESAALAEKLRGKM